MQRNKYDSFLIWFYIENKEYLIPEEIRKAIPYSTVSTWRGINYSDYVGHEVGLLQRDAIEQFEIFQEHKRLKQLVFVITKIWIQLSCIVTPILTKTEEHRQITMNCLQQMFQLFPRKTVFKLLSISPNTFYSWSNKEKVKCGISPSSLCFKRHPLQLAINEIETIKSLYKNQSFECWPAASIYYHAIRNNRLIISLSTFYKYTNLLSLKRKWRKSSEENYNPINTTKPNEFIHIDTTFWPLPNGIKAAIILVCDNFSKAILGWNVSLKKDGENAKAALQNAVESIQKQYPDLQTASLITDGGGENHNILVEDFLTNIEAPEIIKLLALKEVKFSNSAVEAVNKIIKCYLRKKLPETIEALILCLKEIINDYNTVRPHGSLLGLTPMECYTSESINLDFKQQKLEAKKNRIQQNKSVNCGIDVCK